MTSARRAAVAALFLLVAWGASTLAACGGAPAQTGGTTPPPPARPAWESDPTRLFPADTATLVRIDVAAARRAPQWDVIAPLLMRQIGADDDPTLRAMATKADVILVGVAPRTPDHDVRVVMVVEGADLDLDIRSTMARDAPAVSHQVAGHEVVVGDEAVAVHLDARRWAIVDAPQADALLARLTGAGEGPSDARLRALAERIGFAQATAALASHMTDDIRQQIDSVPLAAVHGIESAEYVGARLDLAGGARITGTADMASPEAAAALAQAMTQELDAQSHGMIAMILGVGSILARARVNATGARVDGETSITPDELVSLLQRLQSAGAFMGGQ